MIHTTAVKVRGYHCDYYGHVNNARFLEFMEEARWAYLESNLDLSFWRDRGLGFLVASLTINYRRPAGLGMDLEIKSQMKRLGGKSGVIGQEFVDVKTGKIIADAEVTFVVFDISTGKAVALEGAIRAAFEGTGNSGESI